MDVRPGMLQIQLLSYRGRDWVLGNFYHTLLTSLFWKRFWLNCRLCFISLSANNLVSNLSTITSRESTGKAQTLEMSGVFWEKEGSWEWGVEALLPLCGAQAGPFRHLSSMPCNSKVTWTASYKVTGIRISQALTNSKIREWCWDFCHLFQKDNRLFLAISGCTYSIPCGWTFNRTKSVPGCTGFLGQLGTGLGSCLMLLKSFLAFVNSLYSLCVKIRV